MGLFNASAPIHADLNLLFQIIIFVLLIGGVIVAKLRREFKRHGMVMGIAVILNTFSIAVVMIPSILSFRGLFSTPLSHSALVVITHAVAGILVEILGIWLVITWTVRRHNIKACVRKKNAMRVTAFFWLMELFLGVYVYIMLYVPI